MAAKKQAARSARTARAGVAAPATPREGMSTPAAAGVVVGRIVTGSTPFAPIVDFPGNGAGPLRARATVVLDRVALEGAIVTGQGATLVFENGDPRLPIVTGLLRTEDGPTPFQELLVAPRAAEDAGAPVGQPAFEARLDGDRVVLEGKREIVLKCGEASITLRRDGKMVLRGAYVETYAKGVNRIKGGSVKIN